MAWTEIPDKSIDDELFFQDINELAGNCEFLYAGFNIQHDPATGAHTIKLSDLVPTTSAELAGIISDETGTGALVFATSPTFGTQITTPQIASPGILTLAPGGAGFTMASGKHIGIGVDPSASVFLYLTGSGLTGSNAYGLLLSPAYNQTVGGNAYGIYLSEALVSNTGDHHSIHIEPLNLNSKTVTNNVGIYVGTFTGAGTYNFSLWGNGRNYFGSIGVATTSTDCVAEFNLGTAGKFRLTYDDSNGTAGNYVDFTVSSGGDLGIAPSGGDLALTGGMTASTGFIATGYAASLPASAPFARLGYENSYGSEGAELLAYTTATSAYLPIKLRGTRVEFYPSGTTARTIWTPDGGVAVALVAGEALNLGEVVAIKQAGGADGKVWKCPTTGNELDMPMGVVWASASADAAVWIVVAGRVLILPEAATTATRGYVLEASTATAGRAAQSATSGGTASHWREVGHWLADGSGAGAATMAVLHFN